MTMQQHPRVAISGGFFSAFAKLPRSQQNKVNKFIVNFQKNPMSPGINYETIQDASHSDMRSVRIDQAYRGIVLKPAKGNVYLLLWVDHHDAAYDWARRHHCSINEATGAIQIYEVDQVAGPECDASTPNETEMEAGCDAIRHLRDRELLRLGIPETLIPLARSISGEQDLEMIETRFPEDAAEALVMLLAGFSYEEIINDREAAAEQQQISTDDFAAALDRAVTKRSFYVADDELELQAMLNAPLEKWRVFLHPSQRKIAYGNKNGAMRILGGAGTGKTVVAMHRAKWLAEHAATGKHRVLFTTFTRNLASDIKMNLASICSNQTLENIEVINLDRWVNRYLHQQKYEYRVVYDRDDTREGLWLRAMDLIPSDLSFPDAFYREEWERVIQPQGVLSLESYKRASRIGRGTRLSRSDRVKIWPVFEEYRNLMLQHRLKEIDDAYRDAAMLLQHSSTAPLYDAVVVDEAQDMGAQAFMLLRRLVTEGSNDLFIVGDGHQRIYGRHRVVLSQCGINIRGRARKLRLNYRTTEEIRRSAVRLLDGLNIDDLDGGTDDQRGYHSLSHGEEPQIERFETAPQQNEFLANYLESIRQSGATLCNICIVARTRSEVTSIKEYLSAEGIACEQITGEQSQRQTKEDAVHLATMHRVKGLEFDEVILASMNRGIVPLDRALSGKGDAVEQRQADAEERALVHVAMTRAKKKLIICSYGDSSPYIGATDQSS